MAKNKKIVKEPEIIYFIDNGNVVEGKVLFETDFNYLVRCSKFVAFTLGCHFIDSEKVISKDNVFKNELDCSNELRLRNLEKKQEETKYDYACDSMEENKPWYKRIFN